ncbi:hypothetical protein Q5P01_013775 [Channa striata]|uniref:Uncharacterized protein n=1 Tax=Channa striata TaxID=64152 RepID=A0AA88MNF6_CHASR|nr:hypothetical protein Q5P01_013775 [Channa striata]
MVGLPYLPSADPQMPSRGGQARGEQGSGPGASSALPRIQIEDRAGGGLLAFLHRVLCARPGLGSAPYPLFTLSRFSDYRPSSSSPLNTLPSLLNLFNSPWLLPSPLLLPTTLALFNKLLPSLTSLAITFHNPSSCSSHNSRPPHPSLPLTFFFGLSSVPAGGSRSSLCDTDATVRHAKNALAASVCSTVFACVHMIKAEE